jgi:uncharacterized membrane protein
MLFDLEIETRMETNEHILLTAAALGAITGVRSMAAPALLSHELAERGSFGDDTRLERFLTSQSTSRLLTLFAGGEMLADKVHFVPDRTAALPLLGRAMIGSLTAAAYAVNRRHPVLLPAAVGAAAAVASALAAFHLRRIAAEQLRVPDRLLGMMEDGLVVAASRGIASAMGYR